MRLAIVAADEDAALHAVAGPVGEDSALVVPPGGHSGGAELLVALGDASAERTPDVRWGGDGPALETIATAGERLLRRAPLPAADSLWDLPAGRGALLVGDLEDVAAELRNRGLEARCRPRLHRADLADAAVVAFAGEPGTALPAGAFAVLAAGRVLVAPRADPAFGLIEGADHLAYTAADQLLPLVEAVATFPEAFTALAEIGRVSAESQRASSVYRRLLDDLRASV